MPSRAREPQPNLQAGIIQTRRITVKRSQNDACVHGTRIPVWVLDNCRRLGMTDAQILSAYHSLTPPDLEAASDYVAANRAESEQAIRENEEGDDGLVA
jgi:uncharacterized protein (DUF433 family)